MAYFMGVILIGILLSGLALSGLGHPTTRWPAFAILAPLCVLSHFYKTRGAGHEAWHTNLTFLFAGLLLLPPSLFAILVIIPHLAEWAKERLANSSGLRSWFIQPFNMAMHIISGSAARGVYSTLNSHTFTLSVPSSVISMTAAALAYVLLNHCLIGLGPGQRARLWKVSLPD